MGAGNNKLMVSQVMLALLGVLVLGNASWSSGKVINLANSETTNAHHL